jgi:hypothetical protein
MARISLMTLILAAASKPSSFKVNSVFSSAGAAAAAWSPPGAAAAGPPIGMPIMGIPIIGLS